MQAFNSMARWCGVALSAALLTVSAVGSPVFAAASDVVESPVTLTLTLVGNRPEKAVADYATTVVTPGSWDYGNFPTITQVRDRFGASPARVQRVTEWARRAGLSVGALDATGIRLAVSGSVSAVEEAFGVTLDAGIRDGVRVRTAALGRIPSAVRADVAGVQGLSPLVARPMHVRVGAWGQARVTCQNAVVPAHRCAEHAGVSAAVGGSQDGEFCAPYWAAWNTSKVPQKYPAGLQSNQLCGYTGPQLRALYGLEGSDTGAGQTIVIVGAYNQASTLADANAAFAANGVPALPASRYVVKTYTGDTGVQGCDEAAWHWEQALDVQTVHTLAPEARIVYAAAADCTQLEETLAGVIADTGLGATIVSNSWGILTEPDDSSYLAATNAILARAAILGIGTYVASGDGGDTTTVTGSRTPAVSFPASSPWTTAVGGTTSALDAGNTVLWQTGWENAGNQLSSGSWARISPPFIGGAGGGRSASFAKPTWQSSIPGDTRAVPDLAALADPYTGFTIGTSIDGQYVTGPVGGTSLATPIVASVAALAQARAGAGSDIGLLTPLLYTDAAAGGTITGDVQHVDAGVWTPWLDDTHADGDYLVDVDARVESLTTGAGYDHVTGLGIPGRSFLSDVG